MSGGILAVEIGAGIVHHRLVGNGLDRSVVECIFGTVKTVPYKALFKCRGGMWASRPTARVPPAAVVDFAHIPQQKKSTAFWAVDFLRLISCGGT